MEQLLRQHFASTRISNLIVEPADPPTKAQTTELISKGLAFVALYRLPRPFFKSEQWAENWNELALVAETKLEAFKREHEGDPRGLGLAKRESLWRHVSGTDDRRRPITVLFRLYPSNYLNDSGREVHRMVSYVYRKMIHAAKTVEQASALVFVGHRDWASLTRWQRINVALEAKRYFEEKLGVAVARQAAAASAAARASEPHAQSLGHHLPSLSARQSRRSGISAMELRTRWGGGGAP
ncbi:hypothetical protein BCR35DRAFT_305652 [Leucosporidium creatinivorum]|uniref:Uncharacterized protein n=1 Tax=Leucosporidium creatinivorum TaxID=106004 RepID=A0A1Y2EZ64_9BASI|nr:hypothetical protein BCR35DRAFT_305652 [Leucosporidium creatinivorum]